MYSIDFNILITNNCPNVLLKNKLLALIQVFIIPIKVLYTDLFNYKIQIDEQLRYNSQIIYMTKLLNDKFNGGNVGIYIEDVANISYTKIFNKAEGYPLITLYKKSENNTVITIKKKSEYDSIIDFNVRVPLFIYLQLTANNNKLLKQMQAYINMYKLAGKRYNIISL